MNIPDPFIEAEYTADRAEFLDRYRWKFAGIVFEATIVHRLLTLKDEGDAYERAKVKLLKDCDKWLTAIYDEINKPKGK